MRLLVYTCHQVVITASQFSPEQRGKCLLTAEWFSAARTLGNEIIENYLPSMTLVGRKYYPSRRRLAKTRDAIRIPSISSKGVNAVTPKMS